MTRIELRFIRLKSEVLSELDLLDKLVGEYHRIKDSGADDSMKIRALGSILHDFYTGCERIFERIAQEYDGGLPNSPAWHRQLLMNMTLDLQTVRPPVLSKELASRLTEYLSFRHLFRNIYGFELEFKKMGRLLADLPAIKEEVKAEILAFFKKQEEVISDVK